MSKKVSDETLLVIEEKEQGKQSVKAVTGEFNKNGNPKTVLPKVQNNPDFLKIDRHSNPLENFFSNFMRQCKEPTKFSFFKVPTEGVEKIASAISDIVRNGNVSGKKMLDEYRVKPEDYTKKQTREQEQIPVQKTEGQSAKKTAINENEVDWEGLKKYGVSKEMLQERKCLDTMLNYGKSPVLLPVKMDLVGIKVETEARLAFRKDQDGKVSLSVHGVRKQPELNKPFYGHKFADEEKKALTDTGNLGKVLDMKKNNGTTLPVYVSVDKLTNELVALRADKVKIPDEIKGTKLNEEQKEQLREGKAIFVEGMTARSGKEFSAHLQVNADKRGIEFIFDKKQNQSQQKEQGVRIPTKLGGVELTQQQKDDLKGEKTIYVKGLTDKKGETYNAYIKVNTEKGKLDFFKWNPDKAQTKTPDNAHKIQEAVNSQGKTNEATKDVKEPMKKSESQLTEKQQEKKVEKQQKASSQSRGRKM
jgi:hypothetical protein